MSVLSIRANKRYATRLPVKLRRQGRKAASGLLIELSQQGARISNLRHARYEVGDAVKIIAPGNVEISGTIRWAHDGLAGIRLDSWLQAPEMRALLELNRDHQPSLERRFGT